MPVVVESHVDVLVEEANRFHNAAEDAELRADGALQESQGWRWRAAEKIWELCQQLPSQDAVAFALGRDENFQSQVSMYQRVWAKFGSTDERPRWVEAVDLSREKLPAPVERDRIFAFLAEQPNNEFQGTSLELALAAGIPLHSNNAHRDRTGWGGLNESRSPDSVRETGRTIAFVPEEAGHGQTTTYKLLTGAEAEATAIIAGCTARVTDFIEPLKRVAVQLTLVSGTADASALTGLDEAIAGMVDALSEVRVRRAELS